MCIWVYRYTRTYIYTINGEVKAIDAEPKFDCHSILRPRVPLCDWQDSHLGKWMIRNPVLVCSLGLY